MKLLLIFPRVPYPLRDGGAIAMMQMIKGLHSNGAKITLFFLNTSKHFVNHKKITEIFKEFGVIHVIDINNNVTIKGALLNLLTDESYHISRFENVRAEQELARILKSEIFDVIHFDGLQSSVLLNVVRLNSRAKCILRQHNIEHLIWKRNAKNSSFFKSFYLTLLSNRLKKYEDTVLSEFDGVVAISSVDLTYFKVFNPNLFVASTGVNVSDRHTSFHKDVIFHLGSLDWIPNQEGVKWFLNEVWPLVLIKKPKAKFSLAGRNISSTFYKEIRGNTNVDIIGEVEDAKSFMSNNGIMIVPLMAGSGVRIKILEGLSLGIPIVTTSIGAEGINVENHKHLVIADTAQDFADGLLSFTEEKVESISDNARLFIRENFDNNVISQSLLSFYSNLGEKA